MGEKLNFVTLKMLGIHGRDDQMFLLNAIATALMDDVNENEAAMTITCDDVPKVYCDAFSFELMEEPVLCTVSGKCYESEFIRGYVEQFQKDPVTLQKISMAD